MDRINILNSLIEKYNFTKYLEIGVSDGIVFKSVIVKNIIGVEPNPRFNDDRVIITTSDDFFNNNDKIFDIIFIDGFHESEQVYRDIRHAIQCLSKNGRIVVHDCNPPTKEHAKKYDTYDDFIKVGGYWNGDVFLGYIDAVNNFNVDYYTVDCDWGVGVISLKEDTNINTERYNIINSYDIFNNNKS